MEKYYTLNVEILGTGLLETGGESILGEKESEKVEEKEIYEEQIDGGMRLTRRKNMR